MRSHVSNSLVIFHTDSRRVGRTAGARQSHLSTPKPRFKMANREKFSLKRVSEAGSLV